MPCWHLPRTIWSGTAAFNYDSRKPENRFPVPNCVQAIWFCFAPALPAAMSGIYLGNNQFVPRLHQQLGVTISSMDEPYWKKRHNEARRQVLSRS
ncbi:hypothetical protein MJ579_20060 [Klebsiella pneumoniae]|nr:hypothetical protein MJ579_20060 [Klebsiella pneumoniae]